jgi:hypothetical protein
VKHIMESGNVRNKKLHAKEFDELRQRYVESEE